MDLLHITVLHIGSLVYVCLCWGVGGCQFML